MIDNIIINIPLLNLIQNKKVVLIGPSPYLVNRSYGDLFDSYDIVCRMNDIFPPIEMRKDYGNRTDIVFESCDYRNWENMSFKFKSEEEKANEIKLFFISCIKADHRGEVTVFDIFKRTYEDNGFIVPWTFIGNENYYLIQDSVGCEINTGLMSIILLLHHFAKELLITGFTFFQDFMAQSIDHHYANYYPIKQEFARVCNPLFGHNQETQLYYFKNVILRDFKKILVIDSYLNDLLNVNYENVLILK
jgi:hypothetical protein